jgi:hypothetical protein
VGFITTDMGRGVFVTAATLCPRLSFRMIDVSDPQGVVGACWNCECSSQGSVGRVLEAWWWRALL